MKEEKSSRENYMHETIQRDKVRRLVDEAQVKLDRILEPSPEDARALLKTRAAVLARVEKRAEKIPGRFTILEFLLADERYGIETAYLKEVLPLRELTTLPGVPAFLRGIINVRGRIIPVVDIKKFFDMPDKGLTDMNNVIIIHKGTMEIGILADSVVRVRDVLPGELQTAIPTLNGIRGEYTRGVTPERLIILDIERILDDPDIIIDEKPGKGGE